MTASVSATSLDAKTRQEADVRRCGPLLALALGMLHHRSTSAARASLLAFAPGIGAPGSTGADATARRCRALLLTLNNRLDATLHRADVLRWLASYHHLAVWSEASPRRRSPVVDLHVGQWIGDAQEQIRVVLRCLRDPVRAPGFALDMTLDDWVVPIVEANGERVWRPTDGRKRTLSERAVALLAADYLARPDDYEHLLRQCTSCTRIWFLPESRTHPLARVEPSPGHPPALARRAEGTGARTPTTGGGDDVRCATCRRLQRPAAPPGCGERLASPNASSIAA